jgi:L-lactate dehydrogenase complex protein LldG
MTDQKQAVLENIRKALGTTGPAPDGGAEFDFLRRWDAPRQEIVEMFIERAVDYRSDVHRIAAAEVRAAIEQALHRRGARRVVLPADFPDEWTPSGVEVLPDTGAALTYADLDGADGVVTGCALAIAQTGSLVLDGGPAQGRRALSLLPDYHLCVVRVEQVVGLMPEAVAALGPAVREQGRPITFISGPSATSDIELNRVEGVHGPRTLEILVVG